MAYNYRPSSPDLNFLSSPTKTSQQIHSVPILNSNQLPQHPQHPQQHQLTAQSSSYAPRSPVLPAFTSATPPYQLQDSSSNSYGHQDLTRATELGEYSSGGYMPPIPALPPSHSFSNQQIASPYFSNQPTIKTEEHTYANAEQTYIPSPDMATRNPRGRPPKGASTQPSSSVNQSSFSNAPPADRKNPNPDNIEIKTKFPVARIKRIMQADEEVGKVAQVTPVAVNKALELFMIQLVQGAATISKDKGGKRVTAQHLKQVVESDQQFDFLQEIVAKIGDGQAGAGGETKKKKDSDSEEEVKPKKGRGRKKKSDD